MLRSEVQEGGSERRARLVIADDHELTRVLLRTLVSLHPEIEIVGEAENGEQAAELAIAGEADIVLLDIEMPRMDGLTAAELIRSVRPQVRVILHTASADGAKQARARELGLTVLVKGDFDATIAAVTERLQEAQKGSPLRAGLEALVLSALAARGAEAVVVINAEQAISFYSAAAAKLLRLPLPAERMTLAQMRREHPLFDTESVSSPLVVAISEHRAAEGELSELLPNGALRTYWVKAVPFFDWPTGDDPEVVVAFPPKCDNYALWHEQEQTTACRGWRSLATSRTFRPDQIDELFAAFLGRKRGVAGLCPTSRLEAALST